MPSSPVMKLKLRSASKNSLLPVGMVPFLSLGPENPYGSPYHRGSSSARGKGSPVANSTAARIVPVA